MHKLFLAVFMAAFLMPKIIFADELPDWYYEQFLQQFQEQYEAQLAEQIAALEESPRLTYEVTVTDYERGLLERVAMNEAGNQGIQGMRYVVACVLNRVESSDPFFPDTIEEVVFQPSQFSSWTPKYVSEECKQAVELELKERSDYRVIFFCSAGGYNYYGAPLFRYGGHWFSGL